MATTKCFKADISGISPFIRANDEGLMVEMLALKHFAVAYLYILFYSQSRSTVSLETYPFIHLFIYLFNHIYRLPLYDTSITLVRSESKLHWFIHFSAPFQLRFPFIPDQVFYDQRMGLTIADWWQSVYFTPFRGFIPYLGSYAPIGIAARSNGPYRSPICLNMWQ